MTPSALLAEKIRATTATKTDYATARALGVSQSYLKQVLMGNRNFGVEACVRAAEILHVPLIDVLAEIELPKAQTPEKKAFWERRLPRILPAVAIWGLAAGVTQVTDYGDAVVRNGLTTDLTTYTLCAVLYILTALLELRLSSGRLTGCALGRYAAKMVYKGECALAAVRPLILQTTIPVRSCRQ